MILLTVVAGRGGHDEALLRGLTARDGRVVRRPIAVRQQETHAIYVTACARVQQRALTARVQLVHLRVERLRLFFFGGGGRKEGGRKDKVFFDEGRWEGR